MFKIKEQSILLIISQKLQIVANISHLIFYFKNKSHSENRMKIKQSSTMHHVAN